MINKELHIISFDVPYPADYGGVIDVYYRLLALSRLDYEIHLHCFQYGRDTSQELETICKSVHYYPRKEISKSLSVKIPWFINTRQHPQLLQRLIEIDAPIIFEGLHSSFYCNHPALATRIKVLRAHNVETEYYLQLARSSGAVWKKTYFFSEYLVLRKYEKSLSRLSGIITVSQKDKELFQKYYPGKKIITIPPFHPYEAIRNGRPKERYVLYQGNLKHPENVEAVHFILDKVAKHCPVNFVLAGRPPEPRLKKKILQHKNVSLIENPDDRYLNQLIEEAAIQILPTFFRSGVKLKLLAALHSDSWILANSQMLHGTGLEQLCVLFTNPKELIQQIQDHIDKPIDAEELNFRRRMLDLSLNNQKNALLMEQFLRDLSL